MASGFESLVCRTVPLAQLVEHLTFNQRVASSNLVWHMIIVDIAQWQEAVALGAIQLGFESLYQHRGFMHMKLSIIIPVYNGEKTIARTLESIKIQNFSDYEIIIINDNSTDKSLFDIVQYCNELPIKIINVNLDVHCAGNSRQIGLDNAVGDWITFIDQDDEFEPDAFKNVFELIDTYKLRYICCTMLYEYDDMTDTVSKHTDLSDNIDVWLHGKYYNRENLIKEYNISFKQNQMFLEDLYFNTQIIKTLFKIHVLNKPTFTYYNVETYKWHETGEATHSKIINDRYLFNHWGIANYYCEFVLYPLIEMQKYSRNLESDFFIAKMAYADIAYVYINYNLFCYYYGKNDPIVKILELSLIRILPILMERIKITNVFELVNPTIKYYMYNSNFEREELTKVFNMSFAEWWGCMLTSCS